MMPEHLWIFQTNLHEKLKDRIIGRVFCKVTRSDTLEVYIRNGELTDKIIVTDDLSNKILCGYTTDQAVEVVMKDHRRFILNSYFM